jgi:hypothetical protein
LAGQTELGRRNVSHRSFVANDARGDTVSQLEAMKWDDPCLRLGARIKDLRSGKHDGVKYDIETITEKNADGKGSHAKYRMLGPKILAQGYADKSGVHMNFPAAFPPKDQQTNLFPIQFFR